MRIIKMIYFITFVLTLNACGESEKETGFNIEAPAEDSIEFENIQEEFEIEAEEIEVLEIFPEDIAGTWFMLTENTEIYENDLNEGYSVYKMCYAEQQQIQIEGKKGEEWDLWILYGQDSENFYMSNFTAIQSEKELYQVVEGSFTLTSVYDSRIKNVTFWWNKDISLASFEGLFEGDTFYVREKDRSQYDFIEEICEEP